MSQASGNSAAAIGARHTARATLYAQISAQFDQRMRNLARYPNVVSAQREMFRPPSAPKKTFGKTIRPNTLSVCSISDTETAPNNPRADSKPRKEYTRIGSEKGRKTLRPKNGQ